MNELTKAVMARIFDEFSKHPYRRFGEHHDLVALSCDAECFCRDEENPEYLELSEVAFVVEKQWLIDFLNRDKYEWDAEKLRWWLRNQYTSHDSEEIYEAALAESMIVMIELLGGTAEKKS